MKDFRYVHCIQKNKSSSYEFRLTPSTNTIHIARNSKNVIGINVKQHFFKNSFSICDESMEQARFEELRFSHFGIL